MNISILYVLISIFVGIGATLTFDLWGLFLKHAFKMTPSNMCLVGRWLLYMPEGVFLHSNIRLVPQKRAECVAGWITHYVIGILFAAAFLLFVGNNWIEHPTPTPALIFGLITVAAPFFIMQPAFGLGVATSKTPNPMRARIRTMINHVVFGLGLYLFGQLVGWLH